MALLSTQKSESSGKPWPSQSRGGIGELERLLQLIVSLQILFGSRRGGIAVPLLILALIVGGWFVYRSWYDPNRSLERADQLWDSGDSGSRVAAVREYKSLLRKSDPLEPSRFWLNDPSRRKSLYQKVIEYHVKYDNYNLSDAREWLINAWGENIRTFNFGNDELMLKFLSTEIEQIKKNRDPFGLD